MALFPWRTRSRVLTGRRSTTYDRELLARRRTAEQEVRAHWRSVAEGCGLAKVVHVASGVTVSVPRIGGVSISHDGRPVRMTVQRHPGQSLADYRGRASQLADALGCARVRIEDMGAERWIVLHLLDVDPLAGSRRWSHTLPEGYLATAEDGRMLSAPWQRRPHLAVQGQTGAGKSIFLYEQVAAVAGRADIRVAGIDPTGLIWRPWPPDPWRVSGLRDLDEVRRVLRELVAELDDRLTKMPPDTDNLVTDETTPCVVVVLEEFAGIIRAAEIAGKPILAEVRAGVARLLAESRKVGFRVVLAMQRADAGTADALVRAQCGLRVSFSVDSPEALAFLHPRDSADVAEHATAAPGVAILTAPGIGTLRVRTPLLDYPSYRAAVTRATTGAA